MAFDIIGAKNAGYSDGEIADYLSAQTGFDAAGARKAGYSDQEIIGHVSGSVDVGADKPKEKSSLTRRVLGDTSVSLAKGVIGVPEAFVGLADLATGGMAGKAAEAVGYKPKEAKAILDTLYSPEQQEANAKVAAAKGFIPTVQAALANPSTIVQSAVESAPSMIGAGGIARGGMRMLPKLSPVVAGALGEGAISAGQTAEQVRQESPTGTLSLKQSALAAGSGGLTSALGIVGGKVAQKLGIADIDSFLASGAPIESKKAVARAIVEGAISEGVLEEMPQSYQEQVAQNLATGKPWDEGAANAAASGMITGGLMGAAGNAVGHKAPAAQPAPAGPLSRAVSRAAAPPASIGSLVAERRGMAGPATMSAQAIAAPVGTPAVQPQPEPAPSRAAAPVTGISDLVFQTRAQRAATIPANDGISASQGVANAESTAEGYQDAEHAAQGNAAQGGQGLLEPAGATAPAPSANPPETQGKPDAQISPVAGLSEAGDTQVSPEKAPFVSELDAAAHEAALSPHSQTAEPTPAQIEAGNYRKGHINLHGLDISIENPHGSTRKGVDPNGKPWETTMEGHYGYIKGTVGKDKDHIDVFVKPGTDHSNASNKVFVVNQIDPQTGKLDEHKTMLGYDSTSDAEAGYLANYDKTGPQRIGSIVETTVPDFKAWLKDGDTKRDFAPHAASPATVPAADTGSGIGVEEGAKEPAPAEVKPEVAPTIPTAAPVADKAAATRGVLETLAKPKTRSAASLAKLSESHGRDAVNELAKSGMISFPGKGMAELTKKGREWLQKNPAPLSPVESTQLSTLSKKKTRTPAQEAKYQELAARAGKEAASPLPAMFSLESAKGGTRLSEPVFNGRTIPSTEKLRDLINGPTFLDELDKLVHVPADASEFRQAPDDVRGSASPVQSHSKSVRGDTQFLSGLLRSKPFLEEGYSGLDIETQRAVNAAMLRIAANPKVLKTVVELIPVDVMDMLRREKLTPEMVFHDPAVLKQTLSTNLPDQIPVVVDRATTLVKALALAGAVVDSRSVPTSTGSSAGRPIHSLPTHDAKDGNNRKSFAGRGAGPGAKKVATAVGSDTGRGSDNGNPTGSTVKGNFHGSNISRHGEGVNAFNTSESAPAELTFERVQDAFPKQKIVEKDGVFTVTTPSGVTIKVSKVGTIEFDRAAAEEAYGRKIAPDETPVAEFRPLTDGAIINLTEKGITHLPHEVFHAGMALALNDRQRAAVLKSFGTEEKAAAEYQRLKDSGAFAEKKGHLFLRAIYDFFHRLRQLIAPTAKGVMQDVARGEVWKNADHRIVGSTKYANKAQTDTPEFKRWFGDSKVVDADGKPLVVYHGTYANSDFSEFATSSGEGKRERFGAYFSTDPDYFRGSKAVLPVYLRITNPYIAAGPPSSIRRVSTASGDPSVGLLPGYDELMAKGYDGIIYEGDAEKKLPSEYVALFPTQIKSAIGNRGTFDPTNRDIRYSLKSAFASHNNQAVKAALTTHPRIQALVGSVFNNGRNITPWMRTVGTMYHTAEKLAMQGKPQFKAVFDKGQDFLNDVSSFAVTAESLAPDIFPKMGTGKGIFHNLPRKDAQAIAGPLFDGTLYGGADPTHGKVFSDAELDRLYHLTPHQIELYRQARAATDQSLDDVAKSLVAKNAKMAELSYDREISLEDMAAEVKSAIESKVEDMKAALEQYEKDHQSAKEKVTDEKELKRLEKERNAFTRKQEAAIEAHESFADNVEKIAYKTGLLKKRGYFPLMRFGEYTVTMKDQQGKTEFFGLYESAYKARLMADRLKAQNPNSRVIQSVMGKEKFKLYAGMNLEALQLFAEHLDKEDSAAYQEYLKEGMQNRSAMKRLIHRKGIAGYNEDAVRTLANFIVSNARHASTQYNLHDMRKLAAAIPEDTQGDVQDQAVKLYEYLTKPAEEASKLRGYLFFHYLGGSLASGIVNMTQPVMMTLPYLASKTSPAKAIKYMTAMSKFAYVDPAKMKGEMGTALRRAEADGVTAPQEIYQLTAVASNRLLASNTVVNAGLKAWGGFFAAAEAFNRRITFLSSYQISRDNGVSQDAAYREAIKAVTETQGVYNKGNRPNWARGKVGATLFTFKQFSVMYLELFNRLPLKQKAIMAGTLFLMAGMQGMPFAEDAEDIVDTIGQWAGYSTNSKMWVKNQAESALGKPAASFLLRGVSSVMPIDLQGRMGMQNLIPGTAILKQSEIDKGKDVKEFFGPVGGLLASLGDALGLLATGQPGRATLAALPRALQNAAQGGEMLATGAGHDKYGRKTVEVTPAEALIKLSGFNPVKAAEESQIKSANMQDLDLVRVRKQEIVNQWAYGIAHHDKGEIAEARQKLKEWNEKNPELKIRINLNSVQQKAKAIDSTGKSRFIKSVPKDIRKRIIDELG